MFSSSKFEDSLRHMRPFPSSLDKLIFAVDGSLIKKLTIDQCAKSEIVGSLAPNRTSLSHFLPDSSEIIMGEEARKVLRARDSDCFQGNSISLHKNAIAHMYSQGLGLHAHSTRQLQSQHGWDRSS